MIGVIAAVCLPIAARAFVGPRGALVHIRLGLIGRRVRAANWRRAFVWRTVSASTTRRGVTTSSILSAETISALVGDSAVADTHHINRAASTLSDAERTARRDGCGMEA